MSVCPQGGSPGPNLGGEVEGSDWGGRSPGPLMGGEVEGSSWGGSPGPHPGGLQAHTQGVSRPTPGGVQAHTQGGVQAQAQAKRGIQACTEADTQPPADGCCCGRYASYWNAFLFNILKVLLLESVVHKMVLSNGGTGGVGTDECEVYGGPFLMQSYYYCE